MADMVELVKRAAIDAVLAAKPSDIMFGEVMTVNPVTINIEQRLTLDESFLIFSSLVKDFDVDITVDFDTNELSHRHVLEELSLASPPHNHTCPEGRTSEDYHYHTVQEDGSPARPTDGYTHSHDRASSVTEDAEIQITAQASRISEVIQRFHVSGRKMITLHLALKPGESVILIRAQGGQKFLVLDRLR